MLLALLSGTTLAQEKRSDSNKYYQQGEASFNKGQYQDALSALNRCLQLDPGFADAYATRAATREQLTDLQGAHTDYSIFLELKPNQRDAMLSRAILRYKLEMYDQARDDFTTLLQLPPGETTTVYFKMSASATGKNQITTAQSAIKPQVYNYLGMIDTNQEHYKAAVLWLDSAIYLEPGEPDYYVNRGLAKASMQDTTAMWDYQKALAINPEHAAALHNIAILQRNAGDRKAAIDQLEKAIESDSSMLYPYLERGYQRMEGGYYKGAIEDYTRALEINDRDPEIWLNRGIAYERSGDLRNAYTDYTRAIGLDEQFERAWLNRGNILCKQGKYKEASEDYTVAITYNPDYAFAYYNRAIAFQRLKQMTAACQDLQKAETLGQPVSDKMKRDLCK
jgi:tetratricopeptide (TPR) repeat protein